MRTRTVLPAALAAAAIAATPAAADTTKSVTATGTARTAVKPADRNSNSSFAAAVETAQKAGIAGAIVDARDYATRYAAAAGLTLGSITSVSDAQTGGQGGGIAFAYGGGGFGSGAFIGPFGPNQYCGTIPQPVFKKVNGKRKLVKVKRIHRCIVPPFTTTVLTVTFAAT